MVLLTGCGFCYPLPPVYHADSYLWGAVLCIQLFLCFPVIRNIFHFVVLLQTDREPSSLLLAQRCFPVLLVVGLFLHSAGLFFLMANVILMRLFPYAKRSAFHQICGPADRPWPCKDGWLLPGLTCPLDGLFPLLLVPKRFYGLGPCPRLTYSTHGVVKGGRSGV